MRSVQKIRQDISAQENARGGLADRKLYAELDRAVACYRKRAATRARNKPAFLERDPYTGEPIYPPYDTPCLERPWWETER